MLLTILEVSRPAGWLIAAGSFRIGMAARVWAALDDRRGAPGKGVAVIVGALVLVEAVLIWISPVRRG